MVYHKVKKGIFLKRPNRFIAVVELDGIQQICHVQNTGRCRELLVPGAEVILSEAENPRRKTKYDLIAVYKGGRLINMDSQAPNQAAAEFLPALFPEASLILREKKYGNSRFDFYIEDRADKIFLEVKGVTLEENGVVLFPDAPTQRGVKHLHELCKCMEDGYKAFVLFVIQMEHVLYFTPNERTHPAFAEALKSAREQGVTVLAYDCCVSENSLSVSKQVEVRL